MITRSTTRGPKPLTPREIERWHAIERGEVAPGTKQLRVHLPEPLYVRLTMVAKLNRRTPGYYVTRAIQPEIRAHEKTHGPIVLPPLPTR